MNDYTQYHNNQKRITELELEVAKLKMKLKTSESQKRRFRSLFSKAKAIKEQKVTRVTQARGVVGQWCRGEIKVTLASIAKDYFLAYSTIANMAYQYRQKQAAL